MRSIFPKNKPGYVLLSALLFLVFFSGLVLQIEHSQRTVLISQVETNESNDAKVLCNLLIAKQKDEKQCQYFKTNIGTVEIKGDKFVVTLKNQHSFKFPVSDKPL